MNVLRSSCQICFKIKFEGKLKEATSEMFCKNGVPKNLAKFIGKHLCQSLLYYKIVGLMR